MAQAFARLVSSPDQVKLNAEVFKEVINGPETPGKLAIISTLSHFKSWIAVEDNGSYILAPSKWVGYANMDPDFYFKNHRYQLDGRDTERALAPWLEVVDSDHELWEQLYELCGQHGKKPNGRARISMLRGSEEDVTPDAHSKNVAELLVAVFRSLPAEHQQQVRQRIG